MMNWLKDEEKRTVAAMVISALALGIHFVAGGRLGVNLSWIAVVLCGLPIIIGAVAAVIKEFDIRADVLVSIAIIASVAIGEVFAAAEIAVIMTLGGYLEERTVNKARKGIERLVDLTPEKARVMRDGQEATVDVEDVAVGETVRVLPGEKIPVDGIVLSGDTAVDQSLMTGESLPVDKEKGDAVFCGTMNQFGAVDIQVTKAAEDSSLKRMIRLVESADAGRAPISHLADRWATVIVVLALTAAVVTGLVTGELTRAVTILVVFCPCALVLATPTAIMAGIGNAAKNGILIRSGDALERLAPSPTESPACGPLSVSRHGKGTRCLNGPLPLKPARSILLAKQSQPIMLRGERNRCQSRRNLRCCLARAFTQWWRGMKLRPETESCLTLWAFL